MLIVSTWPSELIDSTTIDGICCKIEIEDEQLLKNYLIKNSYPQNFNDFVELIKDVELWQ